MSSVSPPAVTKVHDHRQTPEVAGGATIHPALPGLTRSFPLTPTWPGPAVTALKPLILDVTQQRPEGLPHVVIHRVSVELGQ
jgi:hypothetical protein